MKNEKINNKNKTINYKTIVKKISRCSSNNRLVPNSYVKPSSGFLKSEIRKNSNSRLKSKESLNNKNISNTHESPISKSKNLKINIDNENINSENKLDEQSPSINKDPKQNDKIRDIRSHLNKFYEAKTQNQKNQVLKDYMTNPSNNNKDNLSKKNENRLGMNIQKTEKNEVLNSLVTKSGISNNNIQKQDERLKINKSENNLIKNSSERVFNYNTNKMNLYSTENKSKIFIESPKKYKEDNILSNENTEFNNLHNLLSPKIGICTFERKRNQESHQFDDEVSEFTKESNINKYNFKKNFVKDNLNLPRSTMNNYNNSQKKQQQINNQAYEDDINNKRISKYENEAMVSNPVTSCIDNSKLNYEIPPKGPREQITVIKNLKINQSNNKRLQELNSISSYLDSLSRDNPVSSNQVSQNVNKINSKISNNILSKTNIVYIPTKVSYNKSDNSRISNQNYSIKDNNEFNSDNCTNHCLDSQTEQESIRHEINKKLKNQVYENEYSRVNNQIDYVNERLKLNELSKSYLMNKITEYSVNSNVDQGFFVENDNQIGI